MAKLLLALALSGVAIAEGKNKAECALNGARAVDDMLDAAVYIMASIDRCDKSPPTTLAQGIARVRDPHYIRCALDISSAIQSVNAMVNVILKAVDACGKLKTDHHKCGLAVGVLTEGFAGLSAASAGIMAKCPNKLNHGIPLMTVGQSMQNAAASAGAMNNNLHGNALINPLAGGNNALYNLQGGSSFGQCIVNVKGSMKSLFKSIKRIMTVKHNCKHSHSMHCAHNSLKIMAGLVGMGEFLSGAIAKCTPYNFDSIPGFKKSWDTKTSAICAQYSMKLVHQLGVVDRASIQMAKDCDLTDDQRLFLEQEDNEIDAPGASSVTLALAALLPMAAVVFFIAGKRFAKSHARQIEPDTESLMPVEE